MSDVVDLTYIAYCEPYFQQCLRIIESTLLCRPIDIVIEGKEATVAFQQHVQDYYLPFLQSALRQIYVCGFIAWYKKRIDTGDIVPEILPLGSFQWGVKPCKKNSPKGLVEYYITNQYTHISVDDIYIIEIIPPVYYGVLRTSSIISPMAHAVTLFRDHRDALHNMQAADCWNSKPQLVYSHNTKLDHSNIAAQINWAASVEEVQNGGSCDDINLKSMDWVRYRRLVCAMSEQQIDCNTANFYPLTDDAALTQLQTISPHLDPFVMASRYKDAICNVLGVPVQLVGGTDSLSNAKIGESYSTSSKVFSNAMDSLGRKMGDALCDVYNVIYAQYAKFTISPVGRLEIQSYEVMQKLLESEFALLPETKSILQSDLHYQLTSKRLKR